MIETETLITVISLGIAGLSCIGGLYFNNRNTSAKDVDRVVEEAKKDAKLEAKMEEVLRNSTQLSDNVKMLVVEFQRTNERTTQTEISIRSLHKRVDFLFDKMGVDTRIVDSQIVNGSAPKQQEV